MLTIFTVPKPFAGHIGIIQRNAIQSWRRMRPACQVFLCGDEAGTAEAAAAVGADQIPAVEQNEFGTPLLSSVFAAVEARAAHDLICYVNADILLLSDFAEAARRIAESKQRFLMVGQRWDLDVTEPLDFEIPDWEQALRSSVERSGSLHPPSGSDYFVFRKGTVGALPPFAVGRPGWDNWMIYRARDRKVAVVDATEATLVVHQNHAYGHVKHSTGPAWEGPEGDRNLELIGSDERIYTLTDATHRLTPGGIRRAHSLAHLKRRIKTMAVLGPALYRIRRLWKPEARPLRPR
jgi:hypothetical protein